LLDFLLNFKISNKAYFNFFNFNFTSDIEASFFLK